MATKDDAKRDDAKDDKRDDAKTDAKVDAKKADADDKDEKSKDDAAKKDEFPLKDKDEEKSKDDADAGTSLEKNLGFIADSLKSMHKRMDAFEEREKAKDDAARKDARKDNEDEKAKGDAKKDDEPAEKEKAEELAAKNDKKRGDARSDAAVSKTDLDDVRRRIEDVRAIIPKDANDDDYHALTDAQSRADDVFITLGKRAPRPLQGETASIYERRCVRMLKEFSPTWKGKDIDSSFRNDEAFAIIRDQVYSQAHQAGMNPASVEGGTLRMIEKRLEGGHTQRTFVGDPRSWMDPFAGSVQMKATGRFAVPGTNRN